MIEEILVLFLSRYVILKFNDEYTIRNMKRIEASIERAKDMLKIMYDTMKEN